MTKVDDLVAEMAVDWAIATAAKKDCGWVFFWVEMMDGWKVVLMVVGAGFEMGGVSVAD